MPVPTYDQFIEPLLRYLHSHPQGASTKDTHKALADHLCLSDNDRAEMLPSLRQATYKNRIGWAHDRLKRGGYSASPKRGHWQITEKGITLIEKYPQSLPDAVITQITKDFNTVILAEQQASSTNHPAHNHPHKALESPNDRLQFAISELEDTVTSDLLDLLLQSSPDFFELVVLDLLHAMGYGTNRQDLQHVGGSSDNGIDGVISLDRLGLEKVYIQAKRWKNTVGRPEIQAFYGALAGQKAKKGVFITTSKFTTQAIQFAQSVDGIILIEGKRLTTLMAEHGIGVTHTVIKVPKIDSDYFEN